MLSQVSRPPPSPLCLIWFGIRSPKAGSTFVRCGRAGGAPWWPPLCLPLAAGEGDVAQVEDGKRVSLRVEDPALKRHQVVAGEQQVEIPVVGGWGWGGG